MKNKFILGTRGSQLALAQSSMMKQAFESLSPGLQCELKVIQTTGDLQGEKRFQEMGAKGLFTKELDEALLSSQIDFAVHSLKDLPSELPPGLCLAAITPCIDERDAFLSLKAKHPADLPKGSSVGTASVRRQALLKELFPHLKVTLLRGNLDSRVKKLELGAFDAIIVAAAGLKRLGLDKKIQMFLDPKTFVPAVGQGSLAIVTREKDDAVLRHVQKLNDSEGSFKVLAQREFMKLMEGGCQVPLGCYGEIHGRVLTLYGYLANVEATQVIREEVQGELTQALTTAKQLAEKMHKQNAQGILKTLRER